MSVSQPTHAGEKLHSAASIRLPFFRSATQSTHRDFATLRGVYLRTKDGAQGLKDAVEAVRATNTTITITNNSGTLIELPHRHRGFTVTRTKQAAGVGSSRHLI